ncbi:MAG: hypothetical protein AAB590_03925 [Patescibacteria group bacterium]
MTTQVIFKIDPKLKKEAQRKASSQGFSYTDILQSMTRAYVNDDFELKIVPKFKEFVPTRKDLISLRKARENFKKGNYFTLEEVKRELGLHKQRTTTMYKKR